MTERHDTSRLRWRWGVAAAVALLLVSLFPQVHFVAGRRSAWNGANATTHPDEVAYSAYVASLIRGNPRRYDPYTGQVNQNGSAPESLFSIQFVPAYTIALPARALGVNASTAFMILPLLCALASSLAIFWFVWLLTRDERFSAAAVLIVLGLGTLVAGQGMVRHALNLNYLIPMWISNRVNPTSLYSLPFLRLYQPAVAFPLFFGMCALICLALTSADRRRMVLAALGGGLLFALLFFSYFYLWTTAASWVGSVCVIWLAARKSERKKVILVFAFVFGLAAIAAFQYGRMLAHRAATMDSMVALLGSRRPDLFRISELIALLVLLLIGIGARRRLPWRDPVALVASAFALTVLIVFNQQIITGKSLQPIHYEWYIGNYCALVALVLTVAWWRRGAHTKLIDRRLAFVAIAALLWATGEIWLAASVSWDYNRGIDEAKPVARRLESLAREGGPEAGAAVVLVSDLKLADRLPTDAPQKILWAPRMLVFPGVTERENRERFYRQLYYLGYDEKRYWKELDRADWNFFAGMFSYDRLSPQVSGVGAAITPAELRGGVNAYLDYARTFNHERAAAPALSYLITSAADPVDFRNLDRWYERDQGERIGSFILYRVKLRE